jgi:hypothetical protein
LYPERMSNENRNGVYLPYKRADITLPDESILTVMRFQYAKGLITYNDLFMAAKDEETKVIDGERTTSNKSISVYDTKNGLLNYRTGYTLNDPEGYDLTINGADTFEYTVDSENSLTTALTQLRINQATQQWDGWTHLFKLPHDGNRLLRDSMQHLTPTPFPTEKHPAEEMLKMTQQVAMIIGEEYTVRLREPKKA